MFSILTGLIVEVLLVMFFICNGLDMIRNAVSVNDCWDMYSGKQTQGKTFGVYHTVR